MTHCRVDNRLDIADHLHGRRMNLDVLAGTLLHDNLLVNVVLECVFLIELLLFVLCRRWHLLVLLQVVVLMVHHLMLLGLR